MVDKSLCRVKYVYRVGIDYNVINDKRSHKSGKRRSRKGPKTHKHNTHVV